MQSALFVVLAFVVAASCLGAREYKEIISKVNADPAGTWKAGWNRDLMNKKEGINHLLGFVPNPAAKAKMPIVSHPPKDLPVNFDSAQQWPECKTIGTIYNQADCGSCWAFGCVEAVQDRFCIKSNGTVQVSLSFEDMTACAPCDGCEGGDPDSAFQFVVDSGLVTATCSPYTVPTCPPAQQPCLNFTNTPNCPSQCSDSENWQKALHMNQNAYDVDSSSMQQEIFSNGPVEACFSVYSDFVTYKSGVYQYTTGDLLGGHCIKIIGWGVENGTPYWLCNNSWTTTWGDNGQFKILRGQDECGIEDDVVAGLPQLSK